MPSRARLVGLLASHFTATDAPRVERLCRLLRSVEEQTVKAPLLVSWSADGLDSVFNQAKAVFHEFERKGVIVSLPGVSRRRSQFQHYSRLSGLLQRHMDTGPVPWVTFSDDDDVWHPRRNEEYAHAITSTGAAVVMSRVHISPGFSPRLSVEGTSETISQLDSMGALHRSVAEEEEGVGIFGSTTGEYFDLAVSCRVLQDFFSRHSDAIFVNTFADIRFRTFCLKWPGCFRFLPRVQRGKPIWMYYYDRPTSAYTTPASEEDDEYLCAELADRERIAGLRQTIDCLLFQFASVDNTITKEKFETIIGMLVNQGPAVREMALHRCEKHHIATLFK